MMNFEELDETTRKYMLKEFKTENEGGNLYPSKLMTPEGLAKVPELIEEAIRLGNEKTLEEAISIPSFWKSSTTSHRKGKPYPKTVNKREAAQSFALTEFNTWYVHGVSKRLMEENETECEVYRAEEADIQRCECSQWEGKKFPLKQIYDGHRKRYHHKEIDRHAISIPSGPNCHHTIRRISN